MNHSLEIKNSIHIEASSRKIWDCLVNPDKIKLYLYGTDAISDWKLGSEIIFQGEYNGKEYKDKGIITQFEPNKFFSYYYWSGFSGLEDIKENYSLVSFEIKTQNFYNKLVITQTGFADEATQKHTDTSWQNILEKIKEIAETSD